MNLNWFIRKMYLTLGVPDWEETPKTAGRDTKTVLDVLEENQESLEPGDCCDHTETFCTETVATRRLERYVVETKTYIGESVAFVSTEGVVLCRHAAELAWTPEPGAQLLLETLPDSCRVTGLSDGDQWIFRYTDAELAEQDRQAHDNAVKAQEAAAVQQREEA